jgi:hypothetical protein
MGGSRSIAGDLKMSTAAQWMGANQTDTPEHTHLVVTLIDDSTITIPLGTWDAENLIVGIFRENVLRVREHGKTIRYVPASQIRNIVPVKGNDK